MLIEINEAVVEELKYQEIVREREYKKTIKRKMKVMKKFSEKSM